MLVVAIDLGGTKIAAAVVGHEGQVLSYCKEAAPREFEPVVDQAKKAVQESDVDWGEIAAVGVIVPGIFDRRTGMAWAPNLWGREEVPLAGELARRFPVPVRIDNDRAGYVLGEQWLGAARGMRDVVFLAVGTGIGAGILSAGRLVAGAGGVAGAAGWFALNPAFQAAYRDMGCWEAEAAGPALARRAGFASAEETAAKARDGDPDACRAVAEAAEYIGMGVANIVSLLNPEIVVLGGGVMQAGDLFLEPVRRAAAKWAQPVAIRQARIELTQLGDRAGLLGAARLALLAPAR